MKLAKSIYIYSFSYNNNIYFYSKISDTFLKFKINEESNFLRILDHPNDFTDLYPKFIDFLFKKGFLINSRIEEFDVLKLYNKLEVFGNHYYHLTINPTSNCNVKCWYCDQNDQETNVLSSDNLSKIKSHIDYIIDNNIIGGLHLDWFGGEPLLRFDEVVYPIGLYAIAKSNSRIKFSHHATTNGICITEEMCQKFMEIELNSFQISMDGYQNKHNKVKNLNGKATYATVVNNIKNILNIVPNSRVTLRINYDNSTLKNIKPLFEEFNLTQRRRITVDFQRVWQTCVNNPAVNNDLLDLYYYLIKIGYSIVNAFFSNKPFTACYSDKYFHAVINYDGKVYKCTADDYEDEMGFLDEKGRIIWFDNHSELFIRTTFDNEVCMTCQYLPFCFGPCTNKIKNISKGKMTFKNACILNSLEIQLQDYLKLHAFSKGLL